jgi:hypothetical protein
MADVGSETSANAQLIFQKRNLDRSIVDAVDIWRLNSCVLPAMTAPIRSTEFLGLSSCTIFGLLHALDLNRAIDL